MKLNRCAVCEKLTFTPYHITEIKENQSASIFDMCKKCGQKYIDNLPKRYDEFTPKDDIEMTHIQTPEETLHFMNGIPLPSKPNKKTSCKCGTKQEEFELRGRIGCAECYDHFGEKIEQLIIKYHNANKHVGRRPKKEMDWDSIKDPVEKLKLLKLHYAKALELEEYEKLANLKTKIDQISNSQ